MEKGRNDNVLLKDSLHGWVDSAAITVVKGAYFFDIYNAVLF